MTNPISGSPRSLPSVQAILQHMAVPLLLFSLVLFGLLFLCWVAVLPLFTALHTSDGTALSPREIAEEQRRLMAELTSMEQERTALVLPLNDPTYTRLKEQKSSQLSLIELRTQLEAAAARVGEADDVIVFTSIAITGDDVAVEGDVRNVGARSMTALAALMDEVQKLPIVSVFERPPFTRETLPDGSFHSPFSFRFKLVSPFVSLPAGRPGAQGDNVVQSHTSFSVMVSGDEP